MQNSKMEKYQKQIVQAPQFQQWFKPQKQDSPQNLFCSQCNTKEGKLYIIFQQFYICTSCFIDQQKLLKDMKLRKIKNNQLFPQIDQILPNLFLGNQDAAIDKKTLEKNQIKAVLVCGNYLMMPHKQICEYKQFNLADNPLQRIDHLFEQSHAWIKQKHKENKKVFIHCAAGISRSASFVIAFLMREKQMGYLEAKVFVQNKRKYIKPNSGFTEQLINYEKKLYNEKIKELTGKESEQNQKQLKSEK